MFMTTVCAHTCRTSILTLYQQPSCFMFIIANDLSKNHDRKRPAIFLRRRASRREAPADKKKSDRPLRAYQKLDVSLPAISKTDLLLNRTNLTSAVSRPLGPCLTSYQVPSRLIGKLDHLGLDFSHLLQLFPGHLICRFLAF